MQSVKMLQDRDTTYKLLAGNPNNLNHTVFIKNIHTFDRIQFQIQFLYSF